MSTGTSENASIVRTLFNLLLIHAIQAKIDDDKVFPTQYLNPSECLSVSVFVSAWQTAISPYIFVSH